MRDLFVEGDDNAVDFEQVNDEIVLSAAPRSIYIRFSIFIIAFSLTNPRLNILDFECE
jgi:hypothetical protein